jgi:hypothetical protein
MYEIVELRFIEVFNYLNCDLPIVHPRNRNVYNTSIANCLKLPITYWGQSGHKHLGLTFSKGLKWSVYINDIVNNMLKPQSHCHVSTATFCYVLKCYVSCLFCQFFMVCTFRYVYTTLFYVLLRFASVYWKCKAYVLLRFTTFCYVCTTFYYASLLIGTV